MATEIPYTVAGFTSPGNFTSETSTQTEYDYENDTSVDLKTYFEVLFMSVCGTVGAVGNGTLILIVLLNSDMRNVPNTLIASLAMGDFVFLVANVPITIASYFHTEYPYSEFVCKLSNAIPILSEGVSVLTLGALSFDRYNAIVRPMHRRRNNAVRQTYLLAFSIWVLAALIAIPGFLIADRRPFSEDFPTIVCFPLPHGTTVAIVHEISRCLLLYVFPLAVITLFYTLIALKLLASSRDMPGESRGDATKQVKARRRLARSVIVLVALFAVCWLPHFIYQLPVSVQVRRR
ncbi:Neuropeptide CCHamide-1 receptor [Holothuria leucospilota]|uniref:Neuropeptide CCHamide-1 receptor n=1 Tax=Holothuria leucospilota TaxID=206669 RepID=A0A9Q0YTP4_HOLLE|nr:Neuropeptide CCHamide-1 receptor [Holothuria leucospilota]